MGFGLNDQSVLVGLQRFVNPVNKNRMRLRWKIQKCNNGPWSQVFFLMGIFGCPPMDEKIRIASIIKKQHAVL
jgi:hypothetical protein